MLTPTKRSLAAALAAGGSLALLAPGAASAAGLEHASGSIYLSPPQQILSYQQVGPVALAKESGQMDFTSGGLVGDGTVSVSAVVTSTGEYTTGSWSGTLTLDGRIGVLSIHFVGTDDGEFQGRMVLKGSGGLAGVTGSGTYSGADATGLGTYSIYYTG